MSFAGLAVAFAFGCGDDSGGPDAAVDIDAPPAGGTVSLSWEIRDSSDGTTVLGCDRVSASSVRLSMIPAAGGSGAVDTSDCGSLMTTSIEFEPKTYNVEVKLIAGANAELDSFRMNGVVVSAETDTPLGNVVFEVLPQARLEFTVNTSVDGPNCAPIANGGAGLNGMRIELRDGAGTCVPTTFEIFAPGGVDPEDTYESDCNPATVHTCIENDRTLRAAIPSGRSSLLSTGLIDLNECYMRTDQFDAAGNDITKTLATQNMASLLNPACDP